MFRTSLLTFAVLCASVPALARTLLSATSPEPRLLQIDTTNRSVLAESMITLPGKAVLSVDALASDPDTGTLFAVVEEGRCPGDPSRTEGWGGCGRFANDATGCAAAFQINDGTPVSCFPRQDGSCIPCLKGNEALTGCTNVCLGSPTCADGDRTFAGNGGCALFNGDPATCVQRFAQSACGPVPCFVRVGTACDECGIEDIEAGRCTASCGALRSRDPVHLATVDPATGVATSIGDLGEVLTGIAFTCDGRLFGVSGRTRCRSASNELLSIDPTTAALTSRLQFDANDDDDVSLTFDGTADRLLRGSGEGDTAQLLAIDPDSFVVATRALSGPAIGERAVGAAWDEQTGDVLWTTTDSQGPLFRIPADGVSVALGTVGLPIAPIAFAGPTAVCDVCGDGTITGFETCDDGNTADGDCCSATCVAEDPGTACTSDGDACTTDVCAAGAVCGHAPIPGADGVRCSFQRLGDPAVCGLSGLPRKVGRKVAPHARRGDRLVQAAVAKPARKAKRLGAAGRELDAIARVLVKRRPALSDACAATLEELLQRVRDGLAGL